MFQGYVLGCNGKSSLSVEISSTELMTEIFVLCQIEEDGGRRGGGGGGGLGERGCN